MRPTHRFLLCLALLMPSHAGFAMRFAYYPPAATEGAGLLLASGEVRLGDEDRFRTALRALPAGTPMPGLSLDSPGGNLEEGLRLATAVRETRLHTVVGDNAKCASACVLVFAAGFHLSASTTALVGVHSASYGGSDTTDAQAATVRMARRLAEYGVPDAILGKMVSAQPSQIWWLNRHDLETMRVDTHVPQVASTPTRVDLSTPASTQTAAQARLVKPGFHIEPATRGYQVAPPTGGFRVWKPAG